MKLRKYFFMDIHGKSLLDIGFFQKHWITSVCIVIFAIVIFLSFFIHPFIPVVMTRGPEFERRPDLINEKFADDLEIVLERRMLFHFRIKNVIFISTHLYYEQDAMWTITNDAQPQTIWDTRDQTLYK